MNIRIMLDIEGVTGAVWGSFGLPPTGELAYDTRLMTEELNVVVRTLQEEGVDEIAIYEAHRVTPGILPSDVLLTRDKDFLEGGDALFFVGQHGMAGDRKAARAHTRSAITIERMFLNGMPCGELTFTAAQAGVLGIPTVFASGDRQTEREALLNLPPLEFVADEEGLTNHSAVCRPFKSLAPELADKTRCALRRIPEARPFAIGRVEMKIKFRYQGMGEKVGGFPFARWEDDYVVIEADDMLAGAQLFLAQVVGRDFWCSI